MTKKEKAIKTIMNSRIESNKMDLKPTFLLKQKQNELRSKIEEEFKKSCGEELGFVSAIFMSQGKIKAKDIVMPTTELEESVDRFGLYLFEAMEKLEDLYKQEIKGILNLDIFANKYSSRFVNKGILMAYDAIKEHIEGKKEEPKGEQNK